VGLESSFVRHVTTLLVKCLAERRDSSFDEIKARLEDRCDERAGGPADPAQVARMIAFLLSGAADHVSGTEMWADATTSLLVG
jgi:NAD(P)-dependent dehydrogenase (short-subunit alcohol dehydrogenase family)